MNLKFLKQCIENILIGILIVFIATFQLYHFNPHSYIQPDYNYIIGYELTQQEKFINHNTSQLYIPTYKKQNIHLYNHIYF